MIDKNLEQHIIEVQEFLDLWKTFFQDLEGNLGRESWDENADAEFLKLKAKLAFRKQVLLDSLGKDEFDFGKDITKVLEMCPSFDLLLTESTIKIDTIKGIWHEVFIALNKLIGLLKLRKQKLAQVSYPAHLAREILQSKALKIGTGVVLAVVAVAVVIQFVDLDMVLDRIKNLLKRE